MKDFLSSVHCRLRSALDGRVEGEGSTPGDRLLVEWPQDDDCTTTPEPDQRNDHRKHQPKSVKSKKSRNVMFRETIDVTFYEIVDPCDDDGDSLTVTSNERRRSVRDAMMHAKIIEHCIRTSSSTAADRPSPLGLPSPDALQKMLPFPEEIVGIEHLVRGKGAARATISLKRYHTKALMQEQRRQDERGVREPMRLAEALRESSELSSLLARGRAAYVAML